MPRTSVELDGRKNACASTYASDMGGAAAVAVAVESADDGSEGVGSDMGKRTGW